MVFGAKKRRFPRLKNGVLSIYWPQKKEIFLHWQIGSFQIGPTNHRIFCPHHPNNTLLLNIFLLQCCVFFPSFFQGSFPNKNKKKYECQSSTAVNLLSISKFRPTPTKIKKYIYWFILCFRQFGAFYKEIILSAYPPHQK